MVALHLLIILSSPFVWNNNLSLEHILIIDFLSLLILGYY